jgi:hypothetical protein
MDPIRLRRAETSFEVEAGEEVAGSGYRLVSDVPVGGLYRVKVAGVSHRREALQSPTFAPGSELTLVPEPENPHDPDAVGVWDAARTVQAGYVPRDTARLIRRRLQHGRIGRVISLWEWRRAASGERVGLEILIAPEIPPIEGLPGVPNTG